MRLKIDKKKIKFPPKISSCNVYLRNRPKHAPLDAHAERGVVHFSRTDTSELGVLPHARHERVRAGLHLGHHVVVQRVHVLVQPLVRLVVDTACKLNTEID